MFGKYKVNNVRAYLEQADYGQIYHEKGADVARVIVRIADTAGEAAECRPRERTDESEEAGKQPKLGDASRKAEEPHEYYPSLVGSGTARTSSN